MRWVRWEVYLKGTISEEQERTEVAQTNASTIGKGVKKGRLTMIFRIKVSILNFRLTKPPKDILKKHYEIKTGKSYQNKCRLVLLNSDRLH